MKTYEEIIQRLARQAFDRHMQGSWDTMPDGMDLVAWIFGKKSTEVSRDVEFHRDALIDEQIKRVRQSA